MGEIKSTLDLVMEKTRHMTMSREEREAQRTEEILKKLNGLILKYTDGLLREGQFLKEFEHLDSIETRSNERMLRKEILDRIELESETGSLLALLEFGCGADIQNLEAILREFTTRRDAAIADRSSELKEGLHNEFGISGSAVVPNLENDAAYGEDLRGLKDTYMERLEAEKSRLLAQALF